MAPIRTPASILSMLTFLASASAAAAQTQPVRFVRDAVAQFNALGRRPDALGFELNGPEPSQCRHHQALSRSEAADGTPYFIVSRNGPPRSPCFDEMAGHHGSPLANLYVVRMGSRDKSGGRLRSNRLRRGMRTSDTPPDPEDKVVHWIAYDGPTWESDFPHYDHPGGMQQVGNVLALGVELPPLVRNPALPPECREIPTPPGCAPLHVPDPTYPPAFVQFLDVADPENPRPTSRFVPPEADALAGVVALTPCGSGRVGVPCATGHYLLAISGGKRNETVHFYESNTTATDGTTVSDLASPTLSWTPLDTWTRGEVGGGEWHSHQTLMFLREGDLGGALFLAGARGGRAVFGSVPDAIDLYRVDLDGSQVRITQVATRHLLSHPAGERGGGARLANLAAASTFYVSPSGELIFYAAEHDNDGPRGTNGRGSVKMAEWRSVDTDGAIGTPIVRIDGAGSGG